MPDTPAENASIVDVIVPTSPLVINVPVVSGIVIVLFAVNPAVVIVDEYEFDPPTLGESIIASVVLEMRDLNAVVFIVPTTSRVAVGVVVPMPNESRKYPLPVPKLLIRYA